MQEGEYNLDELLIKCCNFMDLDPKQVYNNSRKQEIVAVRKAIAIVGYYYLEESQTDIGNFLDRDSSTIQHYCKMINVDKNTLDAVRYILNDVEFNEISILALKVSKHPNDKELRMKLKQLL